MSSKNPTRPDESPISVETAGGWDNSYRNYTNPERKSKGLEMTIFGKSRARQYDSIYEYQESKTPEAKEDAALDAAIQRDLQNRNIKHPKPTD
jgi:hypothetical protein